MPNKELQEQRMKGYFVQATKDLLKGEGLKHVSVRNIAQKAGYSYATLYNYYTDVKELIFECVQDFQEECKGFIAANSKPTKGAEGQIKEVALNFVKYFIEYPGIFELFYIEKTSEIQGKHKNTAKLINSFLSRLCAENWESVKAKGKYSDEDIILLQKNLDFVIIGMLLLYNHRGYPANYTEFLKQVNQQLELIFKR